MAIFDLYSKRQKRLRGDVPDVFTYDSLPDSLRVQIVHIWRDVLGDENDYYNRTQVKDAYEFIVDTLCREYGMFTLPTAKNRGNRMFMNELANFLLQEDDVDRQMDVVELSFRCIHRITREFDYLYRQDASDKADKSINEFNSRLKEHGVGYQFEDDEIVRVDSELIHVEAVKPTLRLLNTKSYQGAQQEFLSAYEHYRHGKNKEALNDCLKSFESTMKSICDKRK